MDSVDAPPKTLRVSPSSQSLSGRWSSAPHGSTAPGRTRIGRLSKPWVSWRQTGPVTVSPVSSTVQVPSGT